LANIGIGRSIRQLTFLRNLQVPVRMLRPYGIAWVINPSLLLYHFDWQTSLQAKIGGTIAFKRAIL